MGKEGKKEQILECGELLSNTILEIPTPASTRGPEGGTPGLQHVDDAGGGVPGPLQLLDPGHGGGRGLVRHGGGVWGWGRGVNHTNVCGAGVRWGAPPPKKSPKLRKK